MDLSQIKPAESKLDLLHPATGDRVGMTLILCCGQDDRVKEVSRKHRDAAAQRAAAAIKAGGKAEPRRSAEVEAEQLEIVAATIVGVEFDDGNDWGGKTEYSKAMALEIAAVDWIATQIAEKLRATGDFFGA